MEVCRGFTPFDKNGNRTYLTIKERNAFLSSARQAEAEVMTFCMVATYTGARISEVLSLTPKSFDVSAQCIIFRCLKKRTTRVYRAVPVPRELLEMLDQVHSSISAHSNKNHRLWPWCRTTAWKRVAEVMNDAGLTGVAANSRGLRHTFAVSAVQRGVALNMVQKWMGHANIETTALYANAVGDEEIKIAKMLWGSFERIDGRKQ